MSRMRIVVWSLLLVLGVLAGRAAAEEVRIFKPMEEDMSAMELRSQALAEGFAQAVLDEARKMLPGALEDARAELFREYLIDHARPYIQGYKILSSEASEGGLILSLDVQVSKPGLREGLKRMGFTETLSAPLAASIVWPEDLDEETRTVVEHLTALTGLQAETGVLPQFTLEHGKEKGTYKGHLEGDDREWMAVSKDIPTLWFDLWGRYFSHSKDAGVRVELHSLTVVGWFSPDGVLEFDRVLRDWDSSAQDVRLVEMDMQPTGVGATWTFRLLDGERLKMLLQGFLPQRGLSFKLAGDAG